VRIGLALTTVPWVQENIVDRFIKNDGRKWYSFFKWTIENVPASERASILLPGLFWMGVLICIISSFILIYSLLYVVTYLRFRMGCNLLIYIRSN
jgi:hypothetical protein